ncbi:MAG: hypothetical protein KGI25_00605 [Thaumarchaeota archaeon]|nr:hypothetical protein [Nitrososphaerota archaeon]
MAMSWKDNSHLVDVHELEYLNKIDWLWNHLSPLQKSRIKFSVDRDTLRQENSKHCIIGEAGRLNNTNIIQRDNLFLDIVFGFANTIFYDGPNYDYLLGKKITKEEKSILDDIYYAKIGTYEHQYKRANELVRFYIASHITAI